MVLTKEKFLREEVLFQLLLVGIIVSLYSFSSYYPIYGGWDDATYILKNQRLSFSLSNIGYWFTHPCVGCYLPLTMLSYMFDYTVWGLNSFGYHLQNIFWHLVAVLAIFNCFRLFKIKSWIAFFLCLIFAIHPQRVESVVWLSERKDVLCGAFYFLSIYFYIRNYDKKFSVTALLFFVVSMLSKSMAVSLPLVLLMYEFYRQRSFNIRYYVLRLWPYFIIIVIFIPITFLAQDTGISTDFRSYSKISLRLYNTLFNIYWYIKQTLSPNDLSPIYPLISFSKTIIIFTIFYFISGVVFIFLIIKKRGFFLFNILPIILCYVFALLPISNIVMVGATDHADRYSYIPSVFLWFSLGLILTQIIYHKNNSNKKSSSILSHKKFIIIVLIFYSLILMESNYQYQKIWFSQYSVYLYSTDSLHPNRLALIYLADLELTLGDYEKVMKIANQLDQKQKGNFWAVYFKTCAAYHLGKRDELINLLIKLKEHFKPLIKKNPDADFRYLKSLDMLIDCCHSANNNKKTIQYTNEALNYEQLNKQDRQKYKKIKSNLLNKQHGEAKARLK